MIEYLTATGITLGLQLGTYFNGPGSFRVENPGIYAKFSEGVTVGGYRNSEKNISIYAGYTFATSDRLFTLSVGGITGYARATVMPVIIPSIRLANIEGVELRLSFFLPKLERTRTNGINLLIEKTF